MINKRDVDKFIDDLLIFVEDDFLSPVHNFNRDLKYSVKELDQHYNCDYRYLFDLYYDCFCSLKKDGNYSNITILYDDILDDYFVEVALEQMNGAEERKAARLKEVNDLIEHDMKLIEEGKIDEVNAATLWIFGIDKK